MGDSQRSFWTTTAGVVTGAAGVLTAVVGLLTVSVQAGWLGSKDNNERPAASSATTTTSANDSSASSGLGSSSPTTTPAGKLSVAPEKLTFQALGPHDQAVKVSNTGSAPLPLRAPFVDGTDKSQFTATGCDTVTRLDAGRSCDVTVTFLATKSGKVSAKLVIQPATANGVAQEVPLEFNPLLG